MNKWIVDFDKKVLKAFHKLDKPVQKRIIDFIDHRILNLDDPRLAGTQLAGELAHLWRYRIGDYRLLCSFKDREMLILVVDVGHRREIYH